MTRDRAEVVFQRENGYDRFHLTARQAVAMIEHSLIFGEKWHAL